MAGVRQIVVEAEAGCWRICIQPGGGWEIDVRAEERYGCGGARSVSGTGTGTRVWATMRADVSKVCGRQPLQMV